MSQTTLRTVTRLAPVVLSASTLAFVLLREPASLPQAQAAAPQTSQELAQLRAEVARLRAARSTATLAAQAVPPEAATAGHEPYGHEKPRLPLEQRFSAEPVDRDFAQEKEAELTRVFAQARGVSLTKVECRSASCRAEFTAEQAQLAQALLDRVPMELGALEAAGGTASMPQDTGPRRFELTLALASDVE